MKILIEEKDETQTYRIVPVEHLLSCMKVYPDRIEIFISNECAGETRITVYKTTIPDGNPECVRKAKLWQLEVKDE